MGPSLSAPTYGHDLNGWLKMINDSPIVVTANNSLVSSKGGQVTSLPVLVVQRPRRQRGAKIVRFAIWKKELRCGPVPDVLCEILDGPGIMAWRHAAVGVKGAWR